MRQRQEKALRTIQLQQLTMGHIISDSYNVYKVNFIENGQLKNAFLKKLDHDYRELLAKMTVAASLYKRIFQGNRSAEERLVLDGDRVVGTLSISMDGFEPLNDAKDVVPMNHCKKEIIIPGIETLIEKNIIELLLGRWFLGEDNRNPHHLSLVGDISFKGFWNWFTSPMKDTHFIGIPKTSVNLTIKDWENFPHINDTNTYQLPSYPQRHNTVPISFSFLGLGMSNRVSSSTHLTQFESLAKYPEAHDQKFVAALKILLTYQPEMIKTRLFELFGDMSLNYTSLGAELRERYEREFPKYCNAENNRKPFVEFIMEMYREHYDNLYRVVVFYMGCDSNRYGVPLSATYTALYQNPSYYETIKQWVIKQNSTLYADDSENLKFNEFELEKKYHQIWRDAFAPIIKDLLFSTYELTNAVNLESKSRKGLLLLDEFYNKLNKIIETYYNKKYINLKFEDNLSFCQQLHELQKDYYFKIKKHLAFASEDAEKFDTIVSGLCEFKFQVNFRNHLETATNQFFSQQLLSKVKKLTLEQGIIEFAFSSINLPLEIDGRRLNHFIELLEKQNSPIADLTCALLLEGRIETTAEILENCKENDEYMEKRTHDAITFYTKASRDRIIKPIAEFLLWDMKMTTQCISIQDRLAQYDLSPKETAIINSYNKANYRAGVSLPLVKELGLFKIDENVRSNTENAQDILLKI